MIGISLMVGVFRPSVANTSSGRLTWPSAVSIRSILMHSEIPDPRSPIPESSVTLAVATLRGRMPVHFTIPRNCDQVTVRSESVTA